MSSEGNTVTKFFSFVPYYLVRYHWIFHFPRSVVGGVNKVEMATLIG